MKPDSNFKCYLTCLAVLGFFLSTPAFAQQSSFSVFSPPVRSTVAKKIEAEASQTITIPLNLASPIYSLSVSGQAWLDDDASLVRILLTDADNHDYLLYEAYPILSGVKNGLISFKQECDETCVLDGVQAAQLKVVVERAVIKIQKLDIVYHSRSLNRAVRRKGRLQYSKELKQKQDQKKIREINNNIERRGLGWIAGPTAVSKLSYSDKARLFGGDLPALQGFEFYDGGYFTLFGETAPTGAGGMVMAKPLDKEPNPNKPDKTDPTPTPVPSPPPVPTDDLIAYPNPTPVISPPSAWDVRNLHGENWLTGIRNQGWCGSCWDFAATAAIETGVNLYFNQHLNLNLSEQDILSCGNAGTCSGGWDSSAISWIAGHSIVDEGCMPYKAVDANGCDYDSCELQPVLCSSKCTNPAVKISVAGYTSHYNENDIKSAIVSNGALSGVVYGWNHAMGLVGYGVVKEGDRIYASTGSGTGKTILAGDPLIGKTYWIFKNSWGSWGEAGFARIVYDSGNPSASAVKLPVTAEGANYSIACNDKDGDGYCNWGNSPDKPASCSSSCAVEKDCDDSDASIGACDFGEVTPEYRSGCREYLADATYCPVAEAACPSGYTAERTNQVCAKGRGKNKYYWTYCKRDFSFCGTCPAGSVLASYQYCSLGQVCSETQNACTAP